MIQSILLKASVASLALAATAMFAQSATGAILTFGCANTNVSCTTIELQNGASFTTGQFLFRKWDFFDFPTFEFQVKPFEDKAAPGNLILQGFELSLLPSATNPLTLTTKGVGFSRGFEYEVVPPIDLNNINNEFVTGTATGAHDFVHISLQTEGAIARCDEVICSNDHFIGTADFAASAFNPFTVSNTLSMFVENGTGGDPFVEVTHLSNSFAEVPEPGSLALIAAGIIAIAVLCRRASGRGTNRLLSLSPRRA